MDEKNLQAIAMETKALMQVFNALRNEYVKCNPSEEEKLKELKIKIVILSKKIEENIKTLTATDVGKDVNFCNDVNLFKGMYDEINVKKMEDDVSDDLDKIKLDFQTQINDNANKDFKKNLEEQFGGNLPKNMKVVQIKVPLMTFPQIVFEIVSGLVLTILLFLALSGFMTLFDGEDIWKIILFGGYFSLTYSIVKITLIKLFPKLISKTFGMILLLPFLVSIIVTYQFPLIIEDRPDFANLFFVAILATVIKKFILSYFSEKLVVNKKARKKNGK